MLGRPASEKRQGTKSREVGHRRCRGLYGDLAAVSGWARLVRAPGPISLPRRMGVGDGPNECSGRCRTVLALSFRAIYRPAVSGGYALDLAQRREKGGEGSRLSERGVVAEEHEVSSLVSSEELAEEQSPEQARENPHREKEPRAARHPARVVKRDA